MREILFRGKSLAGEWKYGDLFFNVTEITVIFEKTDTVVLAHTVIPDTVGQYTGLTDKNGVRIFEGDIIRKPGRNAELFEIRWIEEYARFAAWRPGTVFAVFAFEMGEVVGNVHDNPELLGEEKTP